MSGSIAVLVSVGRHPASRRARRARTDAQAVELGLRLAAAHGLGLEVIHAGDAFVPALRDYLGMGVDVLHVLELPAGADPVPPLADRLRACEPALILTGTRAEAGPGTGCLPFALAAALGCAVAPGCVDAAFDPGGAHAILHQALPRGRRRALRAALPAVVSVDAAAPPARGVAYARARRGELRATAPAIRPVAAPVYGSVRPARDRPRRLQIASGTSAAVRLEAAIERPARATRLLTAESAAEAAERIHAALAERGLLQSAGLEDAAQRNGLHRLTE